LREASICSVEVVKGGIGIALGRLLLDRWQRVNALLDRGLDGQAEASSLMSSFFSVVPAMRSTGL
jgi:hypothetical protein